MPLLKAADVYRGGEVLGLLHNSFITTTQLSIYASDARVWRGCVSTVGL